MTGYSVKWIRLVVQRYNPAGPDRIGDQRHSNPGQSRVLNPEQENALGQWLDAAAQRGARRTCREVAVWRSQRVGHPIRRGVAWCAMNRLGVTRQ